MSTEDDGATAIVQSWIRIVVVSVTLTALGVAHLWIAWSEELPRMALIGSGGGLIVGLGIVFWVTYDSSAELDEPLTAASWITVIRIVAVALLAGVVLGDPTGSQLHPWTPAGLFAIASGLDAIDGAVARSNDSSSTRGARLDMHVDAYTVLVGATAVVMFEVALTAFILLGFAQYVFLFGIRLRTWQGKPTNALPESILRRVLGAGLMIAIWVALIPVIDGEISIIITTIVGVLVLINYSRDWLAISGRPIGYPW